MVNEKQTDRRRRLIEKVEKSFSIPALPNWDFGLEKTRKREIDKQELFNVDLAKKEYGEAYKQNRIDSSTGIHPKKFLKRDIHVVDIPRVRLENKIKKGFVNILPVITIFRFKYLDVSRLPEKEYADLYPGVDAPILLGGFSERGKIVDIRECARRTKPNKWASTGKIWHNDKYVVGSFSYRVYLTLPVTIKGIKRSAGYHLQEVERKAGQSTEDLGL